MTDEEIRLRLQVEGEEQVKALSEAVAYNRKATEQLAEAQAAGSISAKDWASNWTRLDAEARKLASSLAAVNARMADQAAEAQKMADGSAMRARIDAYAKAERAAEQLAAAEKKAAGDAMRARIDAYAKAERAAERLATTEKQAAGDAMRARIDGYARVERAAMQAAAGMKRLDTQTASSAGAVSRGILEVSRGFEDLTTGGFLGILNNIPGTFTAIGQAAKLEASQVAMLTSAASVLGTVGYIVYTNWSKILESFGSGGIKTAAQEMDELSKATSRTVEQEARLLELREHQEELETQRKAKTEGEKDQKKLVEKALVDTREDVIRGLTSTSADALDATSAESSAAADAVAKRKESLKKTVVFGVMGSSAVRSRTPEEYAAAIENDPQLKELEKKRRDKLREAAESLLADAALNPGALGLVRNRLAKDPAAFGKDADKLGRDLKRATPEEIERLRKNADMAKLREADVDQINKKQDEDATKAIAAQKQVDAINRQDAARDKATEATEDKRRQAEAKRFGEARRKSLGVGKAAEFARRFMAENPAATEDQAIAFGKIAAEQFIRRGGAGAIDSDRSAAAFRDKAVEAKGREKAWELEDKDKSLSREQVARTARDFAERHVPPVRSREKATSDQAYADTAAAVREQALQAGLQRQAEATAKHSGIMDDMQANQKVTTDVLGMVEKKFGAQDQKNSQIEARLRNFGSGPRGNFNFGQ